MTSWQDYVLTVVVQVTVVSVTALLLVVCHRGRAIWTHALAVMGLFLVLVSPLLTLALPAQVWWRVSLPTRDAVEHRQRPVTPSPPPAGQDRTQTPPMESSPVIDSQFSAQIAEVVLVPDDDVPHKVDTSQAAIATRFKRRSLWDSLAIVFVGVWITGSIATGTRWFYQYWRIRGLLRALSVTTPITDDQSDRFEAMRNEVSDAVGLREFPAVMASDLIPMPFVWGIWRPVIVVPSDLLRSGCETNLRDVLIHEAAHIARQDAWICVVQHLAGVGWWWHPGIALLNDAVNRSREEICDNFVLRCSDAAHYAQTLLDVTERCCQVTRPVPSLGLFEPRWSLESRIRGLLKPGRDLMTRISRRAMGMMALLFSAICLLIGGIRAVENDPKPAKAAKDDSSQTSVAEPLAPLDADVGLQKVVVRGKCLDDQSQPLAGARVIVLRRSKDYRRQIVAGETTTDANGEFELEDIETAMLDRGDLVAVAALKGHVSTTVPLTNPDAGVITTVINLASDPGTLSGVVRDAEGRPIAGVTVYLPCFTDEPIPGVWSAVTDRQGRYAITDLKRWTPESTKTFDPKTGMGQMTTACNFWLKHPDYPKTTAENSAVPQEVNVTLYPAAIVEGQVMDQVADRPAAGVTVSAQGVGRGGWYQTTTDADGRYRLLMTRDHYNIWAEAEDRIAIAVKAIQAERGKTTTGADIRLVRGGFVVGTVFGGDGKPISPTKEAPSWVAHYGPARPRTGAAVTSTLVEPDGTYRLRVAPGRNYVYCMTGSGTASDVTVEDGQETKFDIHLGEKQRPYRGEDADQSLERKIREAAAQEDAEEKARAADEPAAKPARPKPAARQRAATPAGKLLDELAEQNAGNDHFHDVWCQTMKDIVDLGPEAVPDLIAELDATDNNLMLRCLGFMLRAIGDKRAVPALIRAIPKTLLRPGSDMGLEAEDEAIAVFMRQHELTGSRNKGKEYDFGRPVREIFGALEKMTGQQFGAAELNFLHLSEDPRRQVLQRRLFQRHAREWEAWWNEHGKELVDDPAYASVKLQFADEVLPPYTDELTTESKVIDRSGGAVLSPAAEKGNYRKDFLDLDTGYQPEWPNHIPQDETKFDPNELAAWAEKQGVDLMCITHKDGDGKETYILQTFGLSAWEIDPKYYKDLPELIRSGTIFDLPAADGRLMHYDPELKRDVPEADGTFVYQTHDGNWGLLQITDRVIRTGGNFAGMREWPKGAGFHLGVRFNWCAIVP